MTAGYVNELVPQVVITRPSRTRCRGSVTSGTAPGDEAPEGARGGEQGGVPGARLCGGNGVALAVEDGLQVPATSMQSDHPLPRLAVRRSRSEGVGEPGGERRDLPAPGDAVAAVAADRAGADHVAPAGPGVDPPAQHALGVAQLDLGRGAEVQVPPASCYLGFDLEIRRFLQVSLFLRSMLRGG